VSFRSNPASVLAFVRAVDSALLLTLGALTSAPLAPALTSSSLLIFTNAMTPFVIPLRHTNGHFDITQVDEPVVVPTDGSGGASAAGSECSGASAASPQVHRCMHAPSQAEFEISLETHQLARRTRPVSSGVRRRAHSMEEVTQLLSSLGGVCASVTNTTGLEEETVAVTPTGRPIWLQLGNVANQFRSVKRLLLRNPSPVPINILTVSTRCDVVEYFNVSFVGDSTVQSSQFNAYPATLERPVPLRECCCRVIVPRCAAYTLCCPLTSLRCGCARSLFPAFPDGPRASIVVPPGGAVEMVLSYGFFREGVNKQMELEAADAILVITDQYSFSVGVNVTVYNGKFVASMEPLLPFTPLLKDGEAHALESWYHAQRNVIGTVTFPPGYVGKNVTSYLTISHSFNTSLLILGFKSIPGYVAVHMRVRA
jgi:hypothetical protein